MRPLILKRIALFLLAALSYAAGQGVKRTLTGETFEQFLYPGASEDAAAAGALQQRVAAQFPGSNVRVGSALTADPLRKVLSHYSAVCGCRYVQEGDRFYFHFSKIIRVPASRIEIYPLELGRIHREFRPTRIDIVLVEQPEQKAKPSPIPASLRARIGAFCYPNGSLDESIAKRKISEFGPDAEVFVIDTTDDFDKVHLFFRRLYGAFYVRTSMHDNLLTRDFEIDISRSLGPADADKKLIVTVEENPFVLDSENNVYIQRGHVFITYVIWKLTEEELKQLRLKKQAEEGTQNDDTL